MVDRDITLSSDSQNTIGDFATFSHPQPQPQPKQYPAPLHAYDPKIYPELYPHLKLSPLTQSIIDTDVDTDTDTTEEKCGRQVPVKGRELRRRETMISID